MSSQGRIFRVVVLMTALVLFTLLGAARTGSLMADEGPLAVQAAMLTVSPASGDAGMEVTLYGTGYTPGGYPGKILWDGVEQSIFAIPQGGSFEIPFTVPATAEPGSHTIVVCAGNPCYTGEFEQTASTSFVILGVLDMPGELPIYELVKPDVTPALVSDLGGQLFNLGGEVQEVDERLVLEDGSRSFDIYLPSGGHWFADMAQLWNPGLAPALPDENSARGVADAFLLDNELLPTGQVFDVIFTGFSSTLAATLEEGESRVDSQLDVQANYGVVMHPLVGLFVPVVGGGGEFSVTLGDGGGVIGYSGLWRELVESAGSFPVIGPDEADQMFLAMVQNLEVASFERSLAYFSAPSPESQTFLYPVYVYRGSVEVDGQMVPMRNTYVPATTFSVNVEIVEPAETSVAIGSTELFLTTAAASNGTPPYTYSWSSNIDGPLGTGPSISTPLSIQPKGGLTTHTVKVTVTDANGMTASDSVQVTVVGVELYLPLVARFEANRTSALLAPNFDEGIREAGTSWIGTYGGLTGSQDNAGGFVSRLAAGGWQINFNWGNAAAWESDWIANDDSWVDAADIVFYTGHANGDRWQAAPPNDGWVHYLETAPPHNPRDLWGSNDLEWLIIAACGPLEDDLLSPGGGDVFRWARAFDGLHQLLGYGAVTFDNTTEGRTVANYMQSGQTIINSWFRAGREIQPSTNGFGPPFGPQIWVGVMYVYNSGTTSPYNDHLHGHGSVAPDPINPNIYIAMWTGT